MAPHKPLKLPLAAAEVDRAAHLRGDATYLDSAWPDAAVLLFCDEKFATKNEQLLFTTGAALGKYLDQSDYFLGVKDEKPFFVRHLESSQVAGGEFKTLREVGSFLSAKDIGLAVHAQGLANWHKKHPRCAVCGEKTLVVLAGSVRRCPADQSEHYPRTDSAIIVLVKDETDRI